MDLAALVKVNRSCRRFRQNRPVGLSALRELVDLARYTASAANRQPLKYLLCADSTTNERIFGCLAWAGYLTDWPGPVEGERPAAYIIICGDTTIAPALPEGNIPNFARAYYHCDPGITAQTILLAAREKGLAGCIIESLERDRLRRTLDLPDHLDLLLVLALGVPKEEIVIEQMAPGEGNIEYWRDEQGVHHVPKRALEELVVREWG